MQTTDTGRDVPPESATDSLGSSDRQGQGLRSELPHLSPGDVLDGKYRLERVLGAGGMGVVVAAIHIPLNERVALKILRSPREDRGRAIARFRQEARATVRIQSEHVTRVRDVGTLADGSPYFVMDLLEGKSLSELLRDNGPLSIEAAALIVLQACEGVAAAHAAGIVHRDLKPSNLFVTRARDGGRSVKVLDFGIAKYSADEPNEATDLTSSASVLGSPTYMSPEQLRSSKHVDERTDVWSLGVILHELLAGEPPFEGTSPSARLASIAADPPISLRSACPEAPPGLESLVARCLEKDREKRVKSVASLARGLALFAPDGAAYVERIEALLPNEKAESDPPSTTGASTPKKKRRGPSGVLLWGSAAIVLTIGCATSLALLKGREAGASAVVDPSPRDARSVAKLEEAAAAPAPPDAVTSDTSAPLPATASAPIDSPRVARSPRSPSSAKPVAPAPPDVSSTPKESDVDEATAHRK